MRDIGAPAELAKQAARDPGRMTCKARLVRRPWQDLARDDFSSNYHPALALCLSMIFSENRFPLFGIMR
jgi:hypothetical protein